MKCRACKQEITGDSRFCPACGQPVESGSSKALWSWLGKNPVKATACLLLILLLPLAIYAAWFAPTGDTATLENAAGIEDYDDIPVAVVPTSATQPGFAEADSLSLLETYLVCSESFYKWKDSGYSDMEAMYKCVDLMFLYAEALKLEPERSGLSRILPEAVLQEFLEETAGFDYPYLPVLSWGDISYRDGLYYWKHYEDDLLSCRIVSIEQESGGLYRVRFIVFGETNGIPHDSYAAEVLLLYNAEVRYCPYRVVGFLRNEPRASLEESWISPSEVSPGNPATLKVELTSPQMVYGVELMNGAWESEEVYRRYAKARMVVLEFSDGSRVRYDLPDIISSLDETRSVSLVLEKPVETSFINIIIPEIYPGYVSNRVALSGVIPF